MVADGLPAVIVNPSTPIGPRDVKPTPTGRIIVEAANGKMPAFVDSGLNIAHVDDVAAGHLLAMEKGRIGERYILGGT
ncbi:NAD-dependent epimerase/dehydratase family protein, partial [Acinetobacter baumannii]